MSPTTGLRVALEDVATLGPFFAVTADPSEQVDPTWTPWRDFYRDRSAMSDRVELVARALATSDRRVAASIALQGLAARLVSPVIAVAAVHRIVPRFTPESLHWRPAVSGPWPMWESDPGGGATGPAGTAVRAGSPGPLGEAGLADGVADVLVEPHLAALVQVTREVESVSGRVLRGNVASAAAAAGALVARARPEAARAASVIVSRLLETSLLADAGHFEAGWSFRRRSCCLYYRIPGGGTCGDCVLAQPRARARAGRARQ